MVKAMSNAHLRSPWERREAVRLAEERAAHANERADEAEARARDFEAAAKRFATDRKRYAAAKLNHLTGGWSPTATDVNTLIVDAHPVVRNRIRQLVRDFPPLAKAVNALVDHVVGHGVQFQSQVMGEDGRPDKRARRQIEDCLAFAHEDMDIGGSAAHRLEMPDLEAMAVRQEAETGEAIALVRPHKDKRGRYLPWGVQFMDSDRLTSLRASMGKPGEGVDIKGGVEFDKDTGAIVAFHFMDADSYGKETRVPAGDVIFDYDRRRPGQVRGMSMFAPAVLLAHDLSDALDAELDAFKLASKWLAFIKTTDPEAWQAMRLAQSEATSPTGETETEWGEPIEFLQNAIFEYLRPGEDVTFSANQRGGEQFQAFSRFLLQLASVVADIPYEILSGDYKGANFATLKVARRDFDQSLRPRQWRHIRRFRRPLDWRTIEWGVLTGRIDLPGYWTDPWHYRKGLYIPPACKAIDALRDGKAQLDQVRAGLRSPQEVIMERGRDPEAVLDDIVAWRAMCEERGLDPNMAMAAAVSTGMKNNPAAVNGEDAGDSQFDA